MVKATMFDTVEDLEKLTGLTHDELWNAGFDLDDWDFGFESDTVLHENTDIDTGKDDDEYFCHPLEFGYDGPLHWLTMRMENYCTGPTYTCWNGRHFYLVHHA